MENLSLGIIGSGKIGEALIKGILTSGKLKKMAIRSTDVIKERREYISNKYGIECLESNSELTKKSNIIIMAVKPNDVQKVIGEIRNTITDRHLLVTIAAGVTIGYVLKHLKKKIPVIRGMPNVAVLVQEGMTVLTTINGTNEHLSLARKIFESVGKVAILEERHMNAVTGLSGSGPAYIFMVIESLVEAGVKTGIPRDISDLLAAQTTFGSAKMVLETGEHPALLKDMVTTPGGVTIDGIIQLEEGKLRTSIMKAVVQAAERSKELVLDK
jgi:pyrroline-5-carboxylate reductase